jgi:arylformamidase
MRKLIFTMTAIAVLAAASQAQRGDRLSRECRREVVRLCGIQRDGLRDCLSKNNAQLSEGCYNELGGRIQQRMGQAETKASPTLAQEHLALGGIEHEYGSDPMQKLDFYNAGTNRPAPLVLFVHGGGWKRGDKRNATGVDKIRHYTSLGYHFASINYRLIPEATVEAQAADVASALAYLLKHADRLRIDRSRIVLMGHSAGAHLSALVGTDPQYLHTVGLGMNALSGVVPIDGAAYDVPAQMGDGARIMQATYKQAFGTDPARQKSLSPYHHAQAPNAPAFLILHVDRADGRRQSEALANALRQAGSRIQLNAFAGKGMQGHADINRKLGDPTYPATPVVNSWLKELFAR